MYNVSEEKVRFLAGAQLHTSLTGSTRIRCSGEKPACKHCIRSRIPCVYKQTARKTVPRTDYLTMLDRRLKRMEERVLKNVPKNELIGLLTTTGRSVVKPTITAASGKKRNAELAFEDDTGTWSHSGSMNKQRILEPGGMGMPPLVGDTMVGQDDGSHALPPKDIQEHLTEVFFDFIHGQPYFLVHQPSLMRQLRLVFFSSHLESE